VNPSTATDWRDQPVTVDGQARTWGEIAGGRWFHGSPHPLPVGTVLTGGARPKNFRQSHSRSVSITSLRARAEHWARDATAQAGTTRWFVYEVEPDGPITAWRVGPADYGRAIQAYEARVPRARITAVLDQP
jgi:hypothetical protein